MAAARPRPRRGPGAGGGRRAGWGLHGCQRHKARVRTRSAYVTGRPDATAEARLRRVRGGRSAGGPVQGAVGAGASHEPYAAYAGRGGMGA